jgi:hypothetical protein
MDTSAGWGEGANSYRGENRPTEAIIVYYQKSRHIYGDLKIEILDDQNRVVDTVQGSKRRGLNRATWGLAISKPPVAPPGATGTGVSTGPRVVPGRYTVRLTKNDKVYTTPLNVVIDPRATYTIEDRKAQFALAMKIGESLNHMSWAVDAIIKVRDDATGRAAGLAAGDPLKGKLMSLSTTVDEIRKRIVATKEGGMITGEERLREYLAGLYGEVNGFDGRPTDSQVARATSLDHDIADVVAEFEALAGRELPSVNSQLTAKRLDPIVVAGEADWRKAHGLGVAAR